MVESYLVDGSFTRGGEDGGCTEFGGPEDEAVEGSDEELEGTDC